MILLTPNDIDWENAKKEDTGCFREGVFSNKYLEMLENLEGRGGIVDERSKEVFVLLLGWHCMLWSTI